MKRKSKRTPKQPTGDPKDPKGMVALMEQFCEWMQVRNYYREDRRDTAAATASASSTGRQPGA